MKICRQKGFSILEVVITAALGAFLLFAVFYVVGNILSKAILTEKKVELVNELDKRVSNFMLTGDFDNSSINGITFSQTQDSDGIYEFTAMNADFVLSVVKQGYASLDPVTAMINQQLGPYMQRANEIYIAAGATVIDDPSVLADIEVARATLLSDSTAKWSSSTGVLLNLGPTQIVTALPLSEPPLSQTSYLTVAPFTNADVTSGGIKWKCTAFGFSTGLLPSWCVL